MTFHIPSITLFCIYSISDGSIRHVNVGFELVRDTYKYYIVPELKFSTFGQLCKFYRDHRIGNQEKIDNVRLLNPIKKHTETSHEYATLGHVNSGGSGSSGPGASTDGMHVPQMSQMPFSPFNPGMTFKISINSFCHIFSFF